MSLIQKQGKVSTERTAKIINEIELKVVSEVAAVCNLYNNMFITCLRKHETDDL